MDGPEPPIVNGHRPTTDKFTYGNQAFEDVSLGLSGESTRPAESELREKVTEDPDVTIETPSDAASFKYKLFITVLIYWNMSTLGMVWAQMGPVLPDLQLITGTSLQQITWLLSGFGIGYIAGCLLMGIAQEKFSPRLVLFACTMVTGITAGVLPWITSIYVSVGVKVIQGVTLAGQDILNIAMIFAIWREAAGPYCQFNQIMYAIGCFLAPVYTKPFLREHTGDGHQTDLPRNVSYNSSTNATSAGVYVEETSVHYAFLVSALLSVSAAVPFLVMHVLHVHDPGAPPTAKTEEKQTSKASLPVNVVYIILLLFFCTSFMTKACVDSFPNLLTAFLLAQLGWSQQTASDLTAVYYALYCVGNFLGMFVLKFSTTNKLIVASYVVGITSLAGFLIGSLLGENLVIWVTVVTLGVGVASLMPTQYTWIENHVTHVTGRITAGLMLFGAVGLMVSPILLGYLMDQHSPMWLLYISLGGIVLCAIFYITSFVLVKRCSKIKIRNN